MQNISFLEDETFGNLDPTEFSHYVNVPGVLYVIVEIAKLLICVGSAGASVFLVYVYLKFEKVRRKSSVFLLHYAIGCLIDMLLLPLMTLIIVFSTGSWSSYWRVLCILDMLSSSTYILVFVFGTALGVFWFVENFRQHWIEKFPRFQLYFVIGCYVFCFIKLGVAAFDCMGPIGVHTSHLLIALYCSFMVVLIIINVLVRRTPLNENQRKTKYELDISNYVVFSYAPLLLCSYALYYNFFRYHSAFFIFVEFLLFSTEFLAYSCPIVVVYLLGRKNKYFKASYNVVFKKSARSYDEEDLNAEAESSDGENAVQSRDNAEFSDEVVNASVI
ncbi:uncharacterized protein LOC135140149 [Zophobas morio]|uniref:uncharacterized protein LOC135140149 n=1 Tax=Zophobas morio TaxID=2755281 RepID=UPI003082967D